MKKTYVAPVSEFMSFAVDDVIAAGCTASIDDFGGVKFNESTMSCYMTIMGINVYNPDLAGTACTKYLEGYCYTTSSGNIVFSS